MLPGRGSRSRYPGLQVKTAGRQGLEATSVELQDLADVSIPAGNDQVLVWSDLGNGNRSTLLAASPASAVAVVQAGLFPPGEPALAALSGNNGWLQMVV